MEKQEEIQKSIANATQAYEEAKTDYTRAKAEYEELLSHVKILETAYKSDFELKNPNASIIELHQFLKQNLKTEYERLAAKESRLAAKELRLPSLSAEKSSVAAEKSSLVVKESSLDELMFMSEGKRKNQALLRRNQALL